MECGVCEDCGDSLDTEAEDAAELTGNFVCQSCYPRRCLDCGFPAIPCRNKCEVCGENCEECCDCLKDSDVSILRMTDGYVYCFSNPSMPGILKIGMTERDPGVRVSEIYTTGVPTPFKVELAKRVKNPKDKEGTLHTLLEKYTERVNTSREFFRLNVDEVRVFFELMDGEDWIKKDEIIIEKQEVKKGSRDMKMYFKDGQRIRHTIQTNVWIGVYNLRKNIIVYNDKEFGSLSGFALAHHVEEKTGRPSSNGWAECDCEINQLWVSTTSLTESN